MKRASVLIVDDEPIARARIRDLLEGDPEIKFIEECGDGCAAIAAIRAQAPDVVFLDIQMPEKDGFDVVEAVGVENMPVVIFVTAHDQYALNAFQVYALDYLLKPFDPQRFERTWQRAKAQVWGTCTGDLQQRMRSLLVERRARATYLGRLLIKSGSRLFFLRTEEIDWIRAEGNYLRLHVGKSTYLLRETLNSMEAQLDPEKFLRVHRSTIVRVAQIKELQPMFHGNYRIILADGTQLALSRSYRERLPRVAEKST